MNIAVVDDNRQDADLLTHFLDNYKKYHSFDITVSYYPNGENFLASFCENDYTVIFLDIFMKDMDGIEIAKHLWEKDPQCLIVFLTTSQEHIWQAVSLHCFDYIDKQEMTQQRIFKVLSDIRKKLPDLRRYLDFSSGNRQIHLPLKKIQYILSDNNYTVFRMRNGEEYRYRIPFTKVLKLTGDVDYFLNCNRGILLNMNDIVKEETDVYVMKNGQRFPIRKLDRTSIRRVYHDYQFKKLDEM